MSSAYVPLASLILASVLAAAEPSTPPRPQLIEPPSRQNLRRPPVDDANGGSAGRTTPGGNAGNAGNAAKNGTAGNRPATGVQNAPPPRPIKPAEPAEPPRTGPAPAAVDHDTVILTNEQRFHGTVLTAESDTEQIAINTGSGVLRLARNRVARVEYGLTARVGKVKPDDLAGLVDLAMWCRANARNPEALALLTKAVALSGCELSTRGLYAQLVDEQEGADKALPLYIAYRNAGGEDAAILARLKELETARSAWEEQMRALGLDPGASAAAGAPMAAATSSQVEEGYEKYKWDPDSLDWSAPAKPSLLTLVTPEGPRRVMQLDVEPHPNKPTVDKGAIVLRRPLALREGAKLTMLVANRGTNDVRVGIAVKTGGEWTYYESKPQNVVATKSGQEFAQLSFDLAAADFKSQASGWAHSARIANLGQVRELQILVHNGSRSASLWVAGIAFEGGE